MKNNYIDDEQLLSLIIKWKDEPTRYTSLLIDHIYPTLYKLTKTKVTSFTNKKEIDLTTTSIVQDVFVKLNNGAKNNPLNTLRGFYELLGQIIFSLLMDRQRKSESIKRTLVNANDKNISNSGEIDIASLNDGLKKLKALEPDVAEVLSLKFYSAKSNKQISYIMNQSISTTEKNIRNGTLMMNAIIKGADLRIN